MNPRIRELAEQAGVIPGVMGLNRFTYFDTEKFALLIVRECVTTLEQHHPFTKDPEAYLYAISLIEEHFEVEQ